MLLPLNGRHLYYDLIGSDRGAVVCFAHSLAADSGMWAEQVAPLLQAGFRVLRLDMRGHGGSTPAPGSYSMDELADDVRAVVERLEIPQLHFIGLSIGGMIGQAFVLSDPEKVRSLILCDTSPASPSDAQQRWGSRIELVKKANSLEPIADATMDRWFTSEFRERRPGRWKEIRDTVVGITPQGYIGCANAIQNFDFRAELPTVKAPALVICGADDPGAPPEHAREIAELLPSARFEQIAGARHFPNVEVPEVFNRLILDWLKAHGAH